MDEVSARAKMMDPAGIDSGFTVTVPRSEVEDALRSEDGEAELLLDVVRATNGHKEERRISVAWDREALERLARDGGERVTMAIDPSSLEAAFESEVEAHGVREVGATIAILVAAAGGTAGASIGGIDPGGGSTPLSSSSDMAYSAVEMNRAQTSAPDSAAAIENVRAAREAPAAAPDSSTAIENVRSGGAAVPDPSSGIEAVRTGRTAPEPGGGISISAPSPTAAAGLAGAAALTIAGAAFVLKRRREPGIA